MDTTDSQPLLMEYNSMSNQGNASVISETSSSNGAGFSPGLEGILVPVVFSVVVILGGLGNILVMIVVIKNRDHFRNTTNLFILNLAAADLLFLIFCVPFHAVIYTSLGWPFGQFMCKFVHLVQYSSMIASIMTLVAMSFDRYLAVGYPLRTKHMRTPGKALAIAICIWILSLFVALPWPIFYTIRVYHTFGPQPVVICADDWTKSGADRPTYYLLLFILGYALPLVTITVLSILMVRILWLVEVTPRSQGTRTLESIKAKRKVTKLVIVIVVVFLVCWLPSHIVWLWTNYRRSTWHHTYAFYYTRVFAHVLSYANSAMNPVIYAFLSQNFRNGFRRALLCKRRQSEIRTLPTRTTRSLSHSHDDRPVALSTMADFSL